jgi:hypothetical protein
MIAGRDAIRSKSNLFSILLKENTRCFFSVILILMLFLKLLFNLKLLLLTFNLLVILKITSQLVLPITVLKR